MGKGIFEFGPSSSAPGSSEYKSFEAKGVEREPRGRDPYVLRAIERVKIKFKTGYSDLQRPGKGS